VEGWDAGALERSADALEVAARAAAGDAVAEARPAQLAQWALCCLPRTCSPEVPPLPAGRRGRAAVAEQPTRGLRRARCAGSRARARAVRRAGRAVARARCRVAGARGRRARAAAAGGAGGVRARCPPAQGRRGVMEAAAACGLPYARSINLLVHTNIEAFATCTANLACKSGSHATHAAEPDAVRANRTLRPACSMRRAARLPAPPGRGAPRAAACDPRRAALWRRTHSAAERRPRRVHAQRARAGTRPRARVRRGARAAPPTARGRAAVGGRRGAARAAERRAPRRRPQSM